MKSVAKEIVTEDAPQAIGPYSQGVSVVASEELIFVSGQLPVDPKSGKLIDGDIRAKTDKVIDNIEAVLKASGSCLEQVLRVDIFLKDLKSDFGKVNEIYQERFVGKPKPARQTVQSPELPMGSPIEMSCIAYRLRGQ